jgi:hypothetical protein
MSTASEPPASQPPSERRSQPPSERRAYSRYEIWFPVTLVLPDKEVWSICRDASSKGLLVSAMAAIDVGVDVTATFSVTRGSQNLELHGHVLRHVSNADDLKLAFPYRLAIEFKNAEIDLEQRIREGLV